MVHVWFVYDVLQCLYITQFLGQITWYHHWNMRLLHHHMRHVEVRRTTSIWIVPDSVTFQMHPPNARSDLHHCRRLLASDILTATYIHWIRLRSRIYQRASTARGNRRHSAKRDIIGNTQYVIYIKNFTVDWWGYIAHEMTYSLEKKTGIKSASVRLDCLEDVWKQIPTMRMSEMQESTMLSHLIKLTEPLDIVFAPWSARRDRWP